MPSVFTALVHALSYFQSLLTDLYAGIFTPEYLPGMQMLCSEQLHGSWLMPEPITCKDENAQRLISNHKESKGGAKVEREELH